jgi:hypothetical protein
MGTPTVYGNITLRNVKSAFAIWAVKSTRRKKKDF